MHSTLLLIALSLIPDLPPAEEVAPINATVDASIDAPAEATLPAQDAIYRGSPVSPSESAWKFTSRLHFLDMDGSYSECTAVFVAPDVLLTAAHCDVRNNGLLTVELYRENRPDPAEIQLRGEEYAYRPHPGYVKGKDGKLNLEDLAVLVMRDERLPPGFAPVPFHHSAMAAFTAAGKPVTVAGVGTRENGKNSDRIYSADGEISPLRAPGFLRIAFEGGSGLCEGDSGGPVLVDIEGTTHLAGLTTAFVLGGRSDSCGNASYATLITNDRVNWILSRIRTIREVLGTRL